MKWYEFGFKDATKPFQIRDIWDGLYRLAVPKNHICIFFFVNFNRWLTMLDGETNNLLKAGASQADHRCGEYAVGMKV